MGWNYVRVIILLVLVASVSKISCHDRQTQSFVKIDVSKNNPKSSSETTATVPGNESTSTSTEGAVAVSTTILSTTSLEQTTHVPTTTIAPVSSKPSTEKPLDPTKEGRAVKNVPTGYYCKCDLKINICDVNCCCDIDCSAEILKSFDCNEEPLDMLEYQHQVGLQSCDVQGGLFCLVGDPPHEQDPAFYDSTLKNIMKKHRWKDVLPLTDSKDDFQARTYRVNDPLQLYNETSETLPYSLTNSDCQIKQPIRFLRDQSTECLQSPESLQLFTMDFLEQQISVKYLRVPKVPIMEHCMEQDCLKSHIRFCNLSGKNCSKSNKTDINGEDGEWYCPRLQITILHNYTSLDGVGLSFFCGPLEFSDQGTSSVWHKIAVKFERKDEPKFSRQLSGNLGYLIGKPVIASAVRIPENDTVEERRSKTYMLNYFTNETRKPDGTFRLKLPKSKQNRCVLDDDTHYDILFGENSWNRCHLTPQWNVSAESNITNVCYQLQENIFHFLLNNISSQTQAENYETFNLYLSKYGNPINESSEWIQVRPVNVINDKLTASWSTSANSKQEMAAYFSCNGMVINVNYHFYHARVTVRNVPRQRVLREAEIIFGPRVDLQFALDEVIRVPIYSQVQFFDLTSNNSDGVCVRIGQMILKLALLLGLLLVINCKVYFVY
ncbi:tectonic isoform X2 [Malaya genurostris]|uniref:tectonic isoform X2 n=1 Tax=Malaya genurostris TaxID=325434 RepID=UPI0026F3C973|nr:tectonic isoform X2 [Malaya genurostris]